MLIIDQQRFSPTQFFRVQWAGKDRDYWLDQIYDSLSRKQQRIYNKAIDAIQERESLYRGRFSSKVIPLTAPRSDKRTIEAKSAREEAEIAYGMTFAKLVQLEASDDILNLYSSTFVSLTKSLCTAPELNSFSKGFIDLYEYENADFKSIERFCDHCIDFASENIPITEMSEAFPYYLKYGTVPDTCDRSYLLRIHRDSTENELDELVNMMKYDVIAQRIHRTKTYKLAGTLGSEILGFAAKCFWLW